MERLTVVGVSFLSLDNIKKIKNWPKEIFTHLANATNFHTHWTHMLLRHWSHETSTEILSPPKGMIISWQLVGRKYGFLPKWNMSILNVGYNEVDVDFYFMSTFISNWSCYDLEFGTRLSWVALAGPSGMWGICLVFPLSSNIKTFIF